MNLFYRILPLVLGAAGEMIIGWPNGLYHPIMLIGKMISIAEKILRGLFPKNKKGERIAGIIMAAVLPLISFGVTAGVLALVYRLSFAAGLILETAMCWSIFAAGSLRSAAMEVYDALAQQGLDAGRKSVAMIVGRDTDALSEEGVVKATVETVAENLSDGVIAPLVFTLLGGAPFGYFYKTVNTMDSMVGYKNDKYIYFGTGAAKFDDFCNFLPARLTALLMILTAVFCKMDARGAARIFLRDRYNHASPNSAQTESVMAGALGVQLAGDAFYFGKRYHKKTIGDPDHPIVRDHIKDSCTLMTGTVLFTLIVLTAAAACDLALHFLA